MQNINDWWRPATHGHSDLKTSRHPLLYQVNTRVWLSEIARNLHRPATLDDLPDSDLDRLAQAGFDWLWLLSVWQTGSAGQTISRSHPDWRREFQATLPDLCEQDIAGSGFAISRYTVAENLGGNDALARLRQRLRQRGLKLMLDFVPNHVAPDHPWVETHPEYFIAGTELDHAREPKNYLRVRHPCGDRLFAHGRDPYFPGWPDTLQLDYANPAIPAAMTAELLIIVGQCDGLRCDMAMLVLPEVFARTWGRPGRPFWPEAIRQVRAHVPDFCFLAEVYWDMEATLLAQGFDYAYDKRLYDRLLEGRTQPVRDHLSAPPDYQSHLARFLENHDEPRAAATYSLEVHQAAAIITFLSPGLRFFHQGQLTGRSKRISPHLNRAPEEPVNAGLEQFYARLLEILREPVVRQGQWQLLGCVPAWDCNPSSNSLIAFAWHDAAGVLLLVAVNYAPHHSQAYVRLPFSGLDGRSWLLHDLLDGTVVYERSGDDLQARGLYLDVAPWQCHVLALKPASVIKS